MQTSDIDSILDDDNYMFWLKNAHHLTVELKRYYPDLFLQKHSQKLEKISLFEKDTLNSDDAFVRQISLCTKSQELVFARTVIPVKTYQYFNSELEALGEKPIGEKFLYNNVDFTRSGFVIRQLDQKSFYNETSKKVDDDIYSRSSIFTYKNTPMKILITEYFIDLKNLMEVKNNDK